MLYTPPWKCSIFGVKSTAATITSTGQLQIPKEWRNVWGDASTPVSITDLQDGEGTLIIKPVPKPKRGMKGFTAWLKAHPCPYDLPVPERHILPSREPLNLDE